MFAGMGWGKTKLGPRWHFKRCRDNIDSAASLIVAPDYKLLKSRCLAEYEDFLITVGLVADKDFRIYTSPGDMRIVFRWGPTSWGQTIYFLSGDSPQKIVSFNASHAWCDECGIMHDDVFPRVVQRVRCPNARYRQILWTGTPEGITAFSNRFSAEECKPTENDRFSESEHKLVLHGATFDNIYLPEEFLQALEDEYSDDPAAYANYVLGRPTSLSKDRFYWAFAEHEHVGAYKPDVTNRQLILTFDNNPVDLSWVALQPDADTFRIVRDNDGKARELGEACEQFVERFPPSQWKHHSISVLGDPALWVRSALTHQTGFEIIRTLLKPHYPLLTIDAPRGAPLIRERFRNTNKLLKTKRLLVNKDCWKTVESYKSVEMGPDGKPKKKQGEQITHCAEAVDFALMVLAPPQGKIEFAGLK